MIPALVKRNIKVCLKAFAVMLAVISMYTVIVIYMYKPELSGMFEEYQEMMPEVMAAVGMNTIAGNLTEWIEIYLYGFIMCLFPLIFLILIANNQLMKYIDTGSVASLLASPNSRTRIVLTQAVCMLMEVAALFFTTAIVGIAASAAFFPGELDIPAYLRLNLSAFLLNTAILGILFLAACVCIEIKHFYAFGAGIPVAFYIIKMLANMGGALENLRYATIYSLFSPQSSNALPSDMALLAIACALFAIGCLWFRKRDFSV